MALFRRGKLEMFLSKYNYMPGDSITGNLNLLMKKKKKPILARGLSVALIGRETVTKTKPDGEEKSTVNAIFDLKIPLDGEKEYNGGAYQIDIKIPDSILEGRVARPEQEVKEGTAMKAAKVVRFLRTGELSQKTRTWSRVDWYVVANLDIPRGLDLEKEQQITIG